MIVKVEWADMDMEEVIAEVRDLQRHLGLVESRQMTSLIVQMAALPMTQEILPLTYVTRTLEMIRVHHKGEEASLAASCLLQQWRRDILLQPING